MMMYKPNHFERYVIRHFVNRTYGGTIYCKDFWLNAVLHGKEEFHYRFGQLKWAEIDADYFDRLEIQYCLDFPPEPWNDKFDRLLDEEIRNMPVEPNVLDDDDYLPF